MTVPPTDTKRLTRLLVAFGLPPATSAARQDGYDATVWRTELDDGRVVAVRLLRAGVRADNELAAMRLAAKHGHPVPRVVAAGRADGREAIVMTWCAGRTLGELLHAGGDIDALGQLFGRAQALLHRPIDGGCSLCHLDYQPFNVLVEGGTVTGIVDWANARTGDPRQDLAWTTVVLAFAPALRPEFTASLLPFTAAWRKGYAGNGRFPSETELGPFLAAAARRQHEDWTRRVVAGESPATVTDATAALVARWPG